MIDVDGLNAADQAIDVVRLRVNRRHSPLKPEGTLNLGFTSTWGSRL